MNSLFSRLLVLVAACTALLVARVEADNKYPIVLVHGFGGWGREEFGGWKYWGANNGDFQEELKAQGYEVYTAVVGPFSSNWDRACELYAYIKGGTVNYGPNHAKHHGHNVTGRTCPGLFPQWGEVVNGEVQKVHLVGHSMGGQTIRMLAQLLAHGSKGAPVEEDASSHPLFAGGHDDWVHSITTISTPNEGTTLGDGFNQLGDVAEVAVASIFGALNMFGDSKKQGFFDAKLDQWGLAKRKADESLIAYLKRVSSSSLYHGSIYDNCKYSLSTVGAVEENSWVTTLPNIYYYSFSTADTFESRNLLLKRIHLPRPFSMFAGLQPVATFIGSRFTVDKAHRPESWLQNDGAVNTASMRSDGIAEVVEYDNESKTGRWHHMGVFDRIDHEAIVGVKRSRNVLGIYAGQAELLRSLPTHEVTSRRLAQGEPATHTTPEHVARRMTALFDEVNAFDDFEEIAQACAQATDEQNKFLCAEYLATCQQ
ncbi:TPA: hypothetical protein N0F65_009853 [Lagenidium giganteum]|uniref:Lipase-like C-terminal domain-containing protein n=1 Tax=Lagenidium giganteum TaxID=4803 RepID=A0AAV2YR55_9STRA|nr:TPA: hypothetical protein N0F65_009853 [Lagenidium giganteum]